MKTITIKALVWHIALAGLFICQINIVYAAQAASIQPLKKVYRVGLISYTPASGDMARVRRELEKFGYWEGKNIVYMMRDGVRNGDPNSGAMQVLERDVADMVAWQPDLILSFITNSTTALKRNPATAKIPIIMWGAEPVESGLAISRRHPGRNITGFTMRHTDDFFIMRLLKLMIPDLKNVALLYNGNYSNAPADITEMNEAGGMMNVKVTVYPVDKREDFEAAIIKMKAEGMQAIKVAPHELFNVNGAAIGQLALKHGLAAIGQGSVMRGGGLATSAGGTRDWAEAVPMIDKILTGKIKPADTPFERSAGTSSFVLNLQAVRELHLTIPDSLLDEITTVNDATR